MRREQKASTNRAAVGRMAHPRVARGLSPPRVLGRRWKPDEHQQACVERSRGRGASKRGAKFAGAACAVFLAERLGLSSERGFCAGSAQATPQLIGVWKRRKDPAVVRDADQRRRDEALARPVVTNFSDNGIGIASTDIMNCAIGEELLCIVCRCLRHHFTRIKELRRRVSFAQRL